MYWQFLQFPPPPKKEEKVSLCRPLSLSFSSSQNDVRLIGALETKELWLCRIGDSIAVLNTTQLQENVFYHRYLCHSSIPLRKLDQPVEIKPELVTFLLLEYLNIDPKVIGRTTYMS